MNALERASRGFLTAGRAKHLLPVLAVAASMFTATATGQVLKTKDQVSDIADVEIGAKLGSQLPLDAEFVDQDGNTVRLGNFFGRRRASDAALKPVILLQVYYECPVVCDTTMQLLMESLNELDYTIGEDFEVVVMSFDPSETPNQAREDRRGALGQYNRAELASEGFPFLTGDRESIERVLRATGYEVNRLPNGDYAHPISVIVTSPSGVITHYFPGYDYPSKQVKLSLLDAADGKIANSVADLVLHLCWRPDPNSGKYQIYAMGVMRIAGVITVIFITVGIGSLLIAERVKRERSRAAARRGGSKPDANVRTSFPIPTRSPLEA